VSAPAPSELGALNERLTELTDLGRIHSLLFWDQNTMMPPRGASARANQAAALENIAHGRLIDPEIGRLLDALEPWAAGEDPDSDAVRLLATVRRDHEKAVLVPSELAAEMSHAAALGQQAWLQARATADFSHFRDALARHIELRHRYVACFPSPEHPYDVLLDDFEPGLTTAELRPLFATLQEGLVPLVAAAAGDAGDARNHGVFAGPFEVEDQRRAVVDVLDIVGFDEDGWRLDPAPHPFAQSLDPSDVRITTRYDLHDFGVAHFSALHEFGHGLYEAGVPPELARTPLGAPVSLGVHESQSRLWENLVGRSRPFCAWVLPRLREQLGAALGAIDADALYRAVNSVGPSLIRVDADETTYNLHIVLRFELELALIEGALAVDDVPGAWNEGIERLLGVEVPDDAHGALQDVHWGAGLFGYFPTYTLGNLMAAQLWTRMAADLPDIEQHIEAGEFAPLREWLRENVHRHGRKFPPRELLRRVTGEPLRTEPFLDYLRAKLADVAVATG
jgi:carboxypeptidase Taq